jgi:nitrogen fixation protein NifB
MVKGINDKHIPDVVKKVKELGAFITNIMPLIPAGGSNFEYFPQTSMKDINEMRNICQLDMQQMRHCKQCRADAIGLLGDDRSQEFHLSSREQTPVAAIAPESKTVKIAVASEHGKLVDLHFGHASEFRIYQREDNGNGFKMVETRQVDKYCSGMAVCDVEEDRREAVVKALKDCKAVLTMRIGHSAKERLLKRGIYSIESCDSVENGLRYTIEELQLKEKVV